MPPDTYSAAPGRRHSALAVSLVVIGAAYFPFTLGAGFAGFQVDGALYILLAEYFSPFLPADPLLDYVRQVNHMPPLYPLLLGWAGASGSDLATVHLVQTTCLVAALAGLWYFTAELTRDTVAATVVMWTFALLPATVLYSTEIWSEFLYLALAVAAFYAAARAAAAPRFWWWAAALAGLAAVTRGVGILIVAALVFVLLVRRVRRAALIGAVALLPPVIAEMLALGGGSAYLDIYRHYDVSGLGGLVDTVAANAGLLVAGLAEAFEPAPPIATAAVVLLLSPLVAVGWWSRLRALEADAWYVPAYAGVLLIWPFPHVLARLVYAGLPVMFVYVVVGAAGLAQQAPGLDRRVLVRIAAAALLLPAAAGSAVLGARYTMRDLPGELAAYRSSRYWLTAPERERALTDLRVKRAMIDTLQAARDRVPARECVHSRYPQSVMLYSRRLSWPAPDAAANGVNPCRWHLVVSDAHGVSEIAALAPGYEVVHSERVDGGVAGILVRYPDP